MMQLMQQLFQAVINVGTKFYNNYLFLESEAPSGVKSIAKAWRTMEILFTRRSFNRALK